MKKVNFRLVSRDCYGSIGNPKSERWKEVNGKGFAKNRGLDWHEYYGGGGDGSLARIYTLAIIESEGNTPVFKSG